MLVYLKQTVNAGQMDEHDHYLIVRYQDYEGNDPKIPSLFLCADGNEAPRTGYLDRKDALSLTVGSRSDLKVQPNAEEEKGIEAVLAHIAHIINLKKKAALS